MNAPKKGQLEEGDELLAYYAAACAIEGNFGGSVRLWSRFLLP